MQSKCLTLSHQKSTQTCKIDVITRKIYNDALRRGFYGIERSNFTRVFSWKSEIKSGPMSLATNHIKMTQLHVYEEKIT